MYFQYDLALIERFPATIGGIIFARGVNNTNSTQDVPELAALYTAEQHAVIARIGATPLSDLPSFSAWRGVFRGFGVDPTGYRSAAEALLRRLTKKGDIPQINPLVDLGNLISIRYALPVAMVDTRGIARGLTVHFADGSEHFSILNQADGGQTRDDPTPGEVVFTDENKDVTARRWCWRQSESSAARRDTTDLLITIEGHHAEAHKDVQAALDDLVTLLGVYVGGTFQTALLDRDHLRAEG